MSSILSSQGVVLATAMAVSGTIIFLALSRQRSLPSSQFSGNQDSQPAKQILRSCLCSDDKKRERKKKKVHFADNVKDPGGNGEEFRKEQKKMYRNCGTEIPEMGGMPANRVALYKGILRDRVHRMECSY